MSDYDVIMAVDFRRNPYRGIFSEIARELGVTPEAVNIGARRNRNARYIRLVLERVRERQAMIEEWDRLLNGGHYATC